MNLNWNPQKGGKAKMLKSVQIGNAGSYHLSDDEKKVYYGFEWLDLQTAEDGQHFIISRGKTRWISSIDRVGTKALINK